MRTPTEESLNELIHACEDSIDNYQAIQSACEKAKLLVPNYNENERIFNDDGQRIN